MVTKECETEKTCLFYVSEYHLEMILLPYIKEEIKKSQIILFTENNLEESLKTLLSKVNLRKEDKEQIIKLNWKEKKEYKKEEIEKSLKNNKDIKIIINGSINYIKKINNNLKDIENKNIEIVECFQIENPEINVEEIRKKYKNILNTKKLK